ncbi:hypothetical protein RchiOBHm_Chr6g0267121 [Rosa chinensis]|uniref:Uncharacterized protein n=1 Tax=Rosa chinensis TaxID=74649 RepID=A0A2P6PPV7_ROSCH|nr:hypothetical protein RchiOBHm_Chr6g0267121 [Rosa chinensis]
MRESRSTWCFNSKENIIYGGTLSFAVEIELLYGWCAAEIASGEAQRKRAQLILRGGELSGREAQLSGEALRLPNCSAEVPREVLLSGDWPAVMLGGGFQRCIPAVKFSGELVAELDSEVRRRTSNGAARQ